MPDLVRIFINNLLPMYKTHLMYLGINNFTKLYDIGVQIEDDLLKNAQNDNRDMANNNNKKEWLWIASKGGEANQLENCKEFTPIGM